MRPIFSLLTQAPRTLVVVALTLWATTAGGGEPIRTDGATSAPAKMLLGVTPPAANSLPDLDGSDLGPTRTGRITPAPGFSQAVVAENPQAPGATAVGEKVCVACHRLENEHFSGTLHAKGLRAAAAARPQAPVCEACHGPGSEHARRPTDKGLIIAFTHDSGTPIAVQTGTCLTCHKGGPRDHWLGSVHQRNDLSCSDCHNPMQKVSA